MVKKRGMQQSSDAIQSTSAKVSMGYGMSAVRRQAAQKKQDTRILPPAHGLTDDQYGENTMSDSMDNDQTAEEPNTDSQNEQEVKLPNQRINAQYIANNAV